MSAQRHKEPSIIPARHAHTKHLPVLVAIFLLAALTRIINIDGPALWTDEGFTYYTFTVDLFDALLSDRHPPFYFYTLHAWAGVAGDSILALRWWSFLPSILSIAVAYRIGRELTSLLSRHVSYPLSIAMVRGKDNHRLPGGEVAQCWLPILAALMLALADGENYLAQELRMYTWHVFFAACSTWFYLRYVNRVSHGPYMNTPLHIPGRPHRAAPTTRFTSNSVVRAAIPWIIASVLLIHTHYFGAYVLAAQGLHALLFLRGRVRMGAVVALVMTGVLFLPWFLGVTLQQFSQDAVCVNCAPPDNWPRLLEFRLFWFGQMWPLTMALFGLGIIGLGRRSFVALFVLMIAIPISVTYLLGHEEDIFFAHRLSQITLPITLLLALGIAQLGRRARGVVVAALIVYGVTTIDWYRLKVPWDEVTALIADIVEPGELVLAEVGPEESALRYYLDHMLPPGTVISTYPFWEDTPRFTYYEEQLPALIAAQDTAQTDPVQTIWLIYFSPDPGMMNKVEAAGYIRTLTRTLEHVNDSRISVYRYDKLPDDPGTAYANGMVLAAAEVNSSWVDLWWSSSDWIERDYVVSAFILDADGVLVAQDDRQPPRITSTWGTGDVVYDPHRLPLDDLPLGRYTVGVRVYTFTPDGTIENVLPITETGWDYVVVDEVVR